MRQYGYHKPQRLSQATDFVNVRLGFGDRAVFNVEPEINALTTASKTSSARAQRYRKCWNKLRSSRPPIPRSCFMGRQEPARN